MKDTAERVLNWLDRFFKGRLILGNAVAPSSGMQLTVAGDIGPEASGTRNFGATALRWAAAWFTGNVNIGPVSTGNNALLNTGANAQTDQILGALASATGGNSVMQIFRRSRGTLASPTTVNAVDFIGTISFDAEAGAGPLSLARIIGYCISRAASNDASGNIAFHTRPAGAGAALTGRFEIQGNGSIVCGDQAAALATTATDGFFYIRSCAGVPTGVPTAITGSVPMVYDTTNLRLYVYSGGAWRIH